MALLYMDGFDTYGGNGNAGNLGAAGYTSDSGVTMSNATRTGRGLCTHSSSGFGGQQAGFFSRAYETRDEIVIGCAYKCVNNALTQIMQLNYDDRYGTVRTHITVYKNNQGGITIGMGNNFNEAFFAATGPNVIFANVWQYVEVKFKPGSYVVVRVDGATVLSTGPAKNPSSPNLVNMVAFNTPTSEASLNPGSDKYHDDLYICDTTGALFNDFCGDVVIQAVMPLGDAGPNQFSRFGGGLSNYTCVDDIPSDEDLSYIYSNTLTQQDYFSVDALPSNIIDVLAVSVNSRVKKDAAGTSNIKLLCKLATDEIKSDGLTLTTQYTNKYKIFETAPDAGAWSKVKATNMKIGIEIA